MLKTLNHIRITDVSKERVRKIPTTTGVYLFKKGKQILYIGKSVNMRARLISHLENARIDAKESAIVTQSDSISCIITDSDFKALLLEAQMIQRYKPKYNAQWRDDKSPLYIKITIRDEYPKLFSIRKEFDHKSRYFGPFPSVKSVYEILREIRRVFPFCTQKKITEKSCFHAKINLCHPCPNVIGQISDHDQRIRLQQIYKRNIRNAQRVLEGKTELVLNSLYKKLGEYAQKERYEEALIFRNRIMQLETLLHRQMFSPDITPHYNLASESINSLSVLLKNFFPHLSSIHRIECFDVSNLAQKEATASMVVFTNGLIDKKEYRRFKIKSSSSRSDFEMMQETLQRRFHNTWPLPNLLVVDGGKPQVRIALKILANLQINIPLIGIAKHPDRLVIGQGNLPTVKPPIHHHGFNIIRYLRDESHRFAKKYHVWLRGKRMMYVK